MLTQAEEARRWVLVTQGALSRSPRVVVAADGATLSVVSCGIIQV